MTTTNATHATELRTDLRRTAVFVDFDNIYLGLQRAGHENAAIAFASNPPAWLDRLATGDGGDTVRRRVLIARCYVGCGRTIYRESFVRAGFEMIDCPPLTRQGKNAADIRIVVDALDVFFGNDHVDEFVVVSADADFTPLLLRLRAGDRRTTIVTVGPTAAAYERAADTIVHQERFVSLLTAPAPAVPASPKSYGELSADDLDVLTRLATSWLSANDCGRPALTAAIRTEAAALGLDVSRSAVDRAIGHLAPRPVVAVEEAA